MIAKIHSAIPYGFEGKLIQVEGDMNKGLPCFNIVGMANKTINEAKERVRSALVNSGFSFPDRKVTINLAPADLSKDGTGLDLPIALAILAISGQISKKDVSECVFVGELSLDGKIRPINGIINVVEHTKQNGFNRIFVPFDNAKQAALVSGIEIIGVKNLRELFLHLKHQTVISPVSTTDIVKNTPTDSTSVLLNHIHGQTIAKRALSIAIAGHHNILLYGPPGSGKTMLAKAAVGLLPELSPQEQIDLTKIYALCSNSGDIVYNRPFRSPHHTASSTSIIGGGSRIAPGEISLAHHGVLFLDEFPEFPRNVLEALRQPLEDKRISISRANQKVIYPADFMLIATMNPCPCGYAGSQNDKCTCTPTQIQSYRKKLSGPLLDRIDICLNVQKVENLSLLKTNPQNDQHFVVKNAIKQAVQRQNIRYNKSNFYNSSLSSHQVSTHLQIEPKAEQFLQDASKKLNLSARAYFKIIKVARTIADLDGVKNISVAQISEALTFRYKSL